MKRKSLLFALLVALFMPWAANAQTLTVCDGTTTNSYVPIYGYWADAAQHNQMIYPATDLSVMNGKSITSMTFYLSSGATGNDIGSWTVSLGETTETTLTGLDGTTSLTQVYSGAMTFDADAMTMSFEFDDGYTYHGGNLLVDFTHSSASYRSMSFLGIAATSAAVYQYSSNSATVQNFLPKNTFSYETPSATPKPTGLAVSNVTHNEATLSWTENGTATSWQLCINGDEDHPTTINTNPYTMTGLTPLTAYTVKVRSVGSTENSAWSNELTFSTSAVAEAVGDAWNDDFEGTTCGWELINGTITNAWVWGTATNDGGTHALYVSNDGGTTNAYNNGSPAMVYATKLLNFADGKYEFTYDWNGNGESNYDYLRVALVPATVILTAGTNTPSYFNYSSLPSGWIALDGGSKLNQVTAWQNMSATVNVTAGNYYMVLSWRNDGTSGTNPPAAVDNVSITKMACDQDVTDLAVSEITTNSAILSWDGGEATQWQVAYGTASNFEGATEEIVSTASYNMSGLMTSTMYYVKVRAYCGGEDFGTWCQAISFTTACDVIPALGYTENFDSYTAGTGVLPLCWSSINEGTSYNQYPYIYNYGAYSGSNSLRFYSYGTSGTSDQYAILPQMENMEGKQITLQAKAYNAGNTFKIGMMTDPTDATTFEVIGEKTLTTSYEEYSFILGRGNYVAFLMEAPTGSSTIGIYIDDITIAEAPTCLKPTELAVTSVSTTTATFGWTNGADDQTAWQICLNGDESNLIMANSNPFTVEGLTASTHYTAKVRAYCGADDQSDWSNEVSFATSCEAITDLPWNENFDAYTGSTSSTVPTGYPNDELPMCWQFLNRSDNSSTYPQVFISSINSYPVSGNCLFFKSSSTTPLYAILPAFEEEIAGLQLTFTYRNENITDSNGTLIVGYMTNPADATTFTTVLTCERTTTLTEMEVLFPEAPTGSYIAFMYQGGTSNNYYLSIDNVKVDFIPTCTKPTDLAFVSSTTTTATLSWTAGADETAWQICLNGDETNLIPANSNPFTVEGLTASTSYTAKVRAYCSADDQSDWSNEVSFATECETIVVTGSWSEGFEVGVMPACWSQDGDATWTIGTGDDNTSTAIGAHTGTYNAKISHSDSDNVTKLITPVLDLTSLNNPMLTFWYINRQWVNDIDGFAVYYRTAEDAEWTQIDATEEAHATWTEATYVLPNPSATYQIAFEMTDGYGYGVGIDDVTIEDAPTYTLTIEGVGEENWEGGKGGYYLIASPVTMDLTNHDMTTGDYDLYAFDQAEEDEWRNYKQNAFSLEPGKGYLYAHKIGGEFTLTGTAYSGDGEIELVYDDNAVDFKGWNLVGNPWGVKAYPDHAFYTMAEGGAGIDVTPNDANTEVAPMTGIFVVADAADQTVTFATENPNSKNAKLALNLTNSNKLVDRAIVRFGEGQQLPKFQLNPNHTKVYFQQEGKDYAIVNATEMGEMPVSFKAESNGSYTLSVNAEEVSFAYLHLIDNMTGVETDLLSAPSYSFEAKSTDYANRFKLVFATGNNNGEDFAFFSNGSFVINNEGNATLQVVDVTGRILKSESINGCASVNVNAAPGVYMLRLVNGENVKVQKVVVR